jgi:hypothetical protein
MLQSDSDHLIGPASCRKCNRVFQRPSTRPSTRAPTRPQLELRFDQVGVQVTLLRQISTSGRLIFLLTIFLLRKSRLMDLSWDLKSYCWTYSRQSSILDLFTLLFVFQSEVSVICTRGIILLIILSLEVVDEGKELGRRDQISALEKSANVFFFFYSCP